MLKRLIFGSWMVALVATALPAHAAIYYVGKTACANTNPGTDELKPLCTVQAGVNKLTAGDKLIIGPGTYNQQVRIVNKLGTALQPIMIEGSVLGPVVIDGTGRSHYQEGLLHLEGTQHVTVRGLTVTKSTDYGIKVSTCVGITLDRILLDTTKVGGIIFDQGGGDHVLSNSELTKVGQCESGGNIYNCRHEMVTLSNVRNFKVFNNYLHDSYREGIDAKDGSTDGEIYDNRIVRISRVALFLNHAKRVEVHHNYVEAVKQDFLALGVGDDAEGEHATNDNRIHHNVFWKNESCGIYLFAGGSTGPIHNNWIFNNTVVGAKFEAICSVYLTAAQLVGNRFHNNIFTQSAYGPSDGALYLTTNTWSHNLFFDNAGKNTGPGTNNLGVDPLFVHPTAFQLQATSPAIDKGLALAGYAFFGAAPDLGAYEVESGSLPPDATAPLPPDSSAPSVDSAPPVVPDSAPVVPDSTPVPADSSTPPSGDSAVTLPGGAEDQLKSIFLTLGIPLGIATALVGLIVALWLVFRNKNQS